MSLIPKFCNQCAGHLDEKFIEGKMRLICPECGAIFYRNPLPVAASVVLNDKRQVLMVKRKHDPAYGLWCLPIGFAEIGETIEDAALRELKEETCVEGEIVRLLDSRSAIMELYGDVLVVTFEVKKIGGMELAGDDASEVKYFDIDKLPPMAFDVNNHAIQRSSLKFIEE